MSLLGPLVAMSRPSGEKTASAISRAMPSSDSTSVPAGTFQTVAYVITAVPDPVLELISQYRTGGSRNYGKFSNPELDAILGKTAGELNADARTKLFDEFQQKWITDWRPMIVCHANAVKTMVQGNVAGYDKSAGVWFGYRSTQEIRLRYLVDNGINAYKG